MSIEGRIAIDIGFTDIHTASALQTAQRISFTATDTYTAGKVAVLSGTIATTTIFFDSANTTYRDASGALVSFSSVSRVLCQASRNCDFSDGANSVLDQTLCLFQSTGQQPAEIDITPGYTSGTATYTVVLYGT